MRGSLDDNAIQLLSDAAQECLWRPLREAYAAYADLAEGPAISEKEALFNEQLLTAHRWPAAVAALRRALDRSPFAIRRIVNADRWPPRPDGLEGPLAGFWF